MLYLLGEGDRQLKTPETAHSYTEINETRVLNYVHKLNQTSGF